MTNEASRRILVVGEVLWDVFEESKRLGGAPLSFAAHAKRLGCDPRLISAVGNDELGECTITKIASLELDTALIQRTCRFKTGTAQVHVGPGEQTRFLYSRPAAYDSVTISDEHLKLLQGSAPNWFYYGTLFAARTEGKAVLVRLFEAFPSAGKFYDLNLRPGYDSPELVTGLLARADVVKLNEEELEVVRQFTGLPGRPLNPFAAKRQIGMVGRPNLLIQSASYARSASTGLEEESRTQAVVVRLTGRETELHWQAFAVHDRVDLGAEPTARPPHLLGTVAGDAGSVLEHRTTDVSIVCMAASLAADSAAMI